MNESIKVFLIGMPGSGKTTLAKRVATQLNIQYFDLDDEIEKTTGLKVEEMFKKGENGFRKLETETLTKVIQQNERFILATGGGAPCFNNNLSLMLKSGKVIFLDVPVDEIHARISKQSIIRPLLKGDLKERITSLRNQRVSFYNQADFVVSGAAISVDEIIGLVYS